MSGKGKKGANTCDRMVGPNAAPVNNNTPTSHKKTSTGRYSPTIKQVKELYQELIDGATLYELRYFYTIEIMKLQTSDESREGRTIERNGRGLSTAHAVRLNRLIVWFDHNLKSRECLRAQFAAVLRHYWKQFAAVDGVLDETGKVI